MRKIYNEKEEAKIYLKTKKFPIRIIIESKDQKDDIITQLFHNETIKIGPLVFLKENFSHLIFEKIS